MCEITELGTEFLELIVARWKSRNSEFLVFAISASENSGRTPIILAVMRPLSLLYPQKLHSHADTYVGMSVSRVERMTMMMMMIIVIIMMIMILISATLVPCTQS